MKVTKNYLISLIKEVLSESQYTSKGHWCNQASGVLLTTGERILLLLRSEKVTEGGTWGIPGGAIEDGEDPFESALRESEEEMELAIDSYKVLDQIIFQDDEDGFKYTTYILKIPEELTEKEIILNWENDDYNWVDQDWIENNAHKLHSGVMYILEKKWRIIFDSH
jgi:septum formation protein